MGRYHSNITAREWRAAFIAEHEGSIPRMREAVRVAGMDPAKINWQQPAESVAGDVADEVDRRKAGGDVIRTLASLVGGRDPTKPQCACGRHLMSEIP
jgi:uncharacterized protein YfaQ (DUF2300 family)